MISGFLKEKVLTQVWNKLCKPEQPVVAHEAEKEEGLEVDLAEQRLWQIWSVLDLDNTNKQKEGSKHRGENNTKEENKERVLIENRCNAMFVISSTLV